MTTPLLVVFTLAGSLLSATSLPPFAATNLLAAAAPQRATAWKFGWHAPPGCPDYATVADYVSQRLDRPLTAWSPEHIDVDVHVVQIPTGAWQADVVTDSPEGRARRTLEHPESCDALARGVALVIALAIETRQALPPPAPVEPSPKPSPQRRMRTRADWSLGVAPAAGLAWGILPKLAPTYGGHATVGRNRLRVRADFRMHLPHRLEFGDDSATAYATFSAWEGSLTLGPASVSSRRGEIWFGIGGSFAQAQVVPSGLEEQKVGRPPWVGVLAGFYGELALGRRFALTLAVEPFAAVYRKTARVNPVGEVHRPPPGGIRVTLGLGLHLPARGPARRAPRQRTSSTMPPTATVHAGPTVRTAHGTTPRGTNLQTVNMDRGRSGS